MLICDPTPQVGGVLTMPCMVAVGLTSRIWQVALANMAMGFFMGFFLGGLMNLPNSYITRVFPHKIATARVVYVTALAVGNIIGQSHAL